MKGGNMQYRLLITKQTTKPATNTSIRKLHTSDSDQDQIVLVPLPTVPQSRQL